MIRIKHERSDLQFTFEVIEHDLTGLLTFCSSETVLRAFSQWFCMNIAYYKLWVSPVMRDISRLAEKGQNSNIALKAATNKIFLSGKPQLLSQRRSFGLSVYIKYTVYSLLGTYPQFGSFCTLSLGSIPALRHNDIISDPRSYFLLF
jgi:hypothetical protein